MTVIFVNISSFSAIFEGDFGMKPKLDAPSEL